MRNHTGITATALAAFALALSGTAVHAQDADRAVEDGGIKVQGWMGAIDARAAAGGATIDDALFETSGDGLHIVTGPATTYWNTANRMSGHYTVRATFSEPEYMNLNNHPHPYGIVIGGNDMGGDGQSYLYCAAYGNGRFIVRGFGPAPFQLNGRGEEHRAVNRAEGRNQPVTQEIAVSVDEDSVDCSINGIVVGSYPLSDVVGEGRLASTDGFWGIRVGHNAEVMVTDIGYMRH